MVYFVVISRIFTLHCHNLQQTSTSLHLLPVLTIPLLHHHYTHITTIADHQYHHACNHHSHAIPHHHHTTLHHSWLVSFKVSLSSRHSLQFPSTMRELLPPLAGILSESRESLPPSQFWSVYVPKRSLVYFHVFCCALLCLALPH